MELHFDELRLLAGFRATIRQFQSFSEQICAAEGLTSQQYQALQILAVHQGPQPVTITELAQRLIIRHNSAVGLVDRLEKEGLLTRRPSEEDRRNVALDFTEHGADVVKRLATKHRVELHRVAPELGEHIERLAKEPRMN